MSSFKQTLLGIGAAILSAVIVFGSLALSMVESGMPIAALPTQILDIGSPLQPTIEFQRKRMRVGKKNRFHSLVKWFAAKHHQRK